MGSGALAAASAISVAKEEVSPPTERGGQCPPTPPAPSRETQSHHELPPPGGRVELLHQTRSYVLTESWDVSSESDDL